MTNPEFTLNIEKIFFDDLIRRKRKMILHNVAVYRQDNITICLNLNIDATRRGTRTKGFYYIIKQGNKKQSVYHTPLTPYPLIFERDWRKAIKEDMKSILEVYR